MALTFPRLPVPSFSYTTTAGFRTLISQFENEAEQRRAVTAQAKKIFGLKYDFLKNAEVNKFWNFYQLCKGQAEGFEFQDFDSSSLPYDQTTIWIPLHEGVGTRVDDWNGLIYPTYTVRFLDEAFSKDQFAYQMQNMGMRLKQVEPVSYTNNYGTITNASWALCPDYSSCLDFGIGDYVDVGDAAAADIGTGDFSVAVGVYPNSLASTMGIFGKKEGDTSAYAGYRLTLTTAGQLVFLLADGTNQNTLQSASAAITNQTWNIVIVTIDRDGNGQIYVNGTASGSPTSITANLDAGNARNLYIGKTEGIDGNLKISNFLLAKKVWTAAEIALIYSTWREVFGI